MGLLVFQAIVKPFLLSCEVGVVKSIVPYFVPLLPLYNSTDQFVRG